MGAENVTAHSASPRTPDSEAGAAHPRPHHPSRLLHEKASPPSQARPARAGAERRPRCAARSGPVHHRRRRRQGAGQCATRAGAQRQRPQPRSRGRCARPLQHRPAAAGDLHHRRQGRRRRRARQPRGRGPDRRRGHRRLLRPCRQPGRRPGQRRPRRRRDRRGQRRLAHSDRCRTVATPAAGTLGRGHRAIGAWRRRQQRQRQLHRPDRRAVAQLRRRIGGGERVLHQRLQHHRPAARAGRADPALPAASTSCRSTPAATAPSTGVPTAA